MAGTPRSAAASTWAAAVQRGGYFCSHCCAGAEASSGCAGRSWGLNRRIASRLGRLAVGCAGVERLLESLLLALSAAVADDLPTGLDALVAERPLDGVDVARGRMAQVALQTRVNRGKGRSNGRLANAVRLRVDAERIVDGPALEFGLRGGEYVQGAAVRPPEGGR